MRTPGVLLHGGEGQQLLQRGMRSCEEYAGHRLPLRACRLQRTRPLKRRMLMAPKSKIERANKPKSAPEEIDPVAESSDESFPASDAPAWTTSGRRPVRSEEEKKPKERFAKRKRWERPEKSRSSGIWSPMDSTGLPKPDLTAMCEKRGCEPITRKIGACRRPRRRVRDDTQACGAANLDARRQVR